MDYKVLFNSLNEKLSKANLELEIHCIGGFVLEYYGLKATSDIDAFYQSNETIDRLIAEVGEEYNVGTNSDPWLNNNIQKLISSGSKDDDEVIYAGSNLTVSVSSLESILEDKIIAGRTKDKEDISKLIKALNKRDLSEIMQIYEYSDGDVDPSIIIDAYIGAFGEENFEENLIEHPEYKRYLR